MTGSRQLEPVVSNPPRTWPRRVRRLVVIALCTYMAVVVVVAFLQSHLIYFPSRDYFADPAKVNLPYEDLTLTTADGERVHAWHIPRESAVATVIVFHGNAGNMADRLIHAKSFHQMGYSVLLVEYRGYGRSTGRPSERGTYLDAEAAWAYLAETRGEPPGRIILYGESLGGAVAIELAARHTPAALVVECTFTSLADVAAIHYPLIPARWLLVHRYESERKVGRITCPKLFLHGQDDTLVPMRLARRLFEAAAEPKQFLETPGGHNDGGFLYSPEYGRKVQEYLSETLARQQP